MQEYDDEDALDAEIAKMLEQDSDEAPAPETDTAEEETNSIDQDPAPESVKADTPDDVTEQRLKNAQARMHQATTEAAELRKSNAYLQEQINLMSAKLAELQQPKEADDFDDLEILANDYPEIATPLIKQNKLLERKIAELQNSLSEVKSTTDRVVQHESQSLAEKHLNTIKQAHPDIESLAVDPELEEWKVTQPFLIQYALEKGAADDVILALNLFKQYKGIPVQKEDKITAARSASTPSVPRNADKTLSSKKTFTRDEIAKMSMDEFMKNESAIDELLAKRSIA